MLLRPKEANEIALLDNAEGKITIKMDYWNSDWFFIQIMKLYALCNSASLPCTDYPLPHTIE